MKTIYPFLLFCLLHMSLFAAQKNMEVDQERHALVAPKGASYQWFLNHEPLHGQREQTLTVTQAGHYSVLVVDEKGQTSQPEAKVALNAAGAIIKVYLIGDSTVCNYAASAYPQTGWGQMLPYFFNMANVQIDNRAIGGRSSRSFMEQGRWTPIKDALAAGDFVFIQFGHNDRDTKPERYTSTTDYKTYLTTYVNDTKAKGAYPILVSPMVMNAWSNGTMRNVFTESGNNYRGAMQEVATKLNVPFIDLNMKSWNLYKGLGQAYITRFVYHTYPAGEYPNYPDGITDGTHFQEMGAIDNARLVVEGLSELSTTNTTLKNLSQYLRPQYEIAVSVNPKGSDNFTTRTATYPQGIQVTLKTLPKTGKTFQKWNNAAGTSVSTKSLFSLKAGATKTSYSALYVGAVVTDFEETLPESSATFFPNPFSETLHLHTSGPYAIYDLTGTLVESGTCDRFCEAGQHLPQGMYVLEWEHQQVKFRSKISKR